jgi:hypothetical protein
MASILGLILSAALAICVVTGSYLLKLKNDHFIEQITESIIEDQTGIDIDLSPEDSKNTEKI